MSPPELSVIIPCYNEQGTIGEILRRVQHACGEVAGDYECIVVDDGSTDETVRRARAAIVDHDRCCVIATEKNAGKTAAVNVGLAHALGRWVIIQDADLEYDPASFPKLLAEAKRRDVVAVYGKRPSHWQRPDRMILAGGVLLIDLVILGLHGRFVRDHATCHKLVRRDVLESLELESLAFDGCVEITCKLIRLGHTIAQVPIPYTPRSRLEGKKLTWRHGFGAVRRAWVCRGWRVDVASTG